MKLYKDAGTAISQQHAILTASIYARQRQRQPELETLYDAEAHEKSRRDTGYHLSYLAEALMAVRPALFLDYITWARSMLQEYHVPIPYFRVNLECMQEILHERLPEAYQPAVDEVLTPAIARLGQAEPRVPSFIDTAAAHGALAQEYLAALLAGDRRQATRVIMDAVAAGVSIRDIYMHVFQPAQYEIGRLWQLNQISVAHEHFATAATQMIISQLYPHIFDMPRKDRRLVAASISDELHELGIRMVADFFEMEGWDTHYLGANTPTASIIRLLEETRADLLAISATLTLHISQVARTIAQIRAASDVRIMVGGYPFNIAPDLWQEIGADGYAPNAAEALIVAARLVG